MSGSAGGPGETRVPTGIHLVGNLNLNTHSYLAQVNIPSLQFTIHGKFQGVLLSDGGKPYQAILGRAFLVHFKMIYERRTGSVKLTRLMTG